MTSLLNHNNVRRTFIDTDKDLPESGEKRLRTWELRRRFVREPREGSEYKSFRDTLIKITTSSVLL